ncbi:MAG TPA: hypothetical protein VJ809_08205, partial [Pirellulales bacterium]|nr:hypothetical protein [Pirellulales bacterium]
MITPLVLAGLAWLSAFFLTELVRRVASHIGAVDLPSDRKMHHQPIPRLGGVAVVGAVVLTCLAGQLSGLWDLSH